MFSRRKHPQPTEAQLELRAWIAYYHEYQAYCQQHPEPLHWRPPHPSEMRGVAAKREP
jgi:hypothetical protein